jgi:hypothetical protein
VDTTRKSPARCWLWLGLILPILPASCLWHKDSCEDKSADVTPGAIPQPAGSYVNEAARRQIAKARQEEFVIYLYEWQTGMPVFGPFGARHIEQMAHRLALTAAPVVIEPDCDRHLNEARHAAVVNYLAQHGVPEAIALVTIGFPQAEGLYGDEAPHIYQQMISPHGGNTGGNNQNTNPNTGNHGILGGVSGIGGEGGLGGLGGVGGVGGR